MRAIPPRTMSDVSRAVRTGIRFGASRIVRPAPRRSEGEAVRVVSLKKPREWRYQTRPSFKRVRGPLVDVFNEAEEVLIVVDLGGFTRGEISVSMNPQHYILQAVRGEQRFSEVIELPPNVDVTRSQERLLHGVLEIVLPRRKEDPVPAPTRRRPARER
jgi:HSP20 family molecular chaperone IbpA